MIENDSFLSFTREREYGVFLTKQNKHWNLITQISLEQIIVAATVLSSVSSQTCTLQKSSVILYTETKCSYLTSDTRWHKLDYIIYLLWHFSCEYGLHGCFFIGNRIVNLIDHNVLTDIYFSFDFLRIISARLPH